MNTMRDFVLCQYGMWSFQTRAQNYKYFLPKNQHTLRKLLNFKNWFHGASEVFKNQSFKNQLISSPHTPISNE